MFKFNKKKLIKDVVELTLGSILFFGIGVFWFWLYADAIGHPWHPFG